MLNTVETREYTKQWNRYCTDYITEYAYTIEKSLSVDEFNKILESAKAYLYGQIEYVKRKLVYKSGKTEFKHICRVITY